MSPQSKLEHIIYLVREYEQDLIKQQDRQDCTTQINSMNLMSDEVFEDEVVDISTIQPKAQVYLERIEAFLGVSDD